MVKNLIVWLLERKYMKVDEMRMLIRIVKVIIVKMEIGLVIKKIVKGVVKDEVKMMKMVQVVGIVMIVEEVVEVKKEDIEKQGMMILEVVVMNN